MSDRKHLVESAGFWFKASRQKQDGKHYNESIMAMENAYNHVENALEAARRELAQAIAERDEARHAAHQAQEMAKEVTAKLEEVKQDRPLQAALLAAAKNADERDAARAEADRLRKALELALGVLEEADGHGYTAQDAQRIQAYARQRLPHIHKALSHESAPGQGETV